MTFVKRNIVNEQNPALLCKYQQITPVNHGAKKKKLPIKTFVISFPLGQKCIESVIIQPMDFPEVTIGVNFSGNLYPIVSMGLVYLPT